ncbi:MAG TPA: chemotaxis protein CheW [Acidobacteriaceae bacterium]|nr:chemotaxis protein CheW [Acidobacteriaceae bacterium]
MSDRQQFATFFLGDSYFGVEVERVQEILRSQEMTPVPLSSPVVRGLINLRGQIVTAIDLRRQLGLPARTDARPLMNVVVRSSGGGVSLLVDDIGDVVEAEESSFERPPDTLDDDAQKMIRGVHKLNERLMHVLDTEGVLIGFSEAQS